MYLFVCDQINQSAVFEYEIVFITIIDNVGGNPLMFSIFKISLESLKLPILYYPLHGDARVF